MTAPYVYPYCITTLFRISKQFLVTGVRFKSLAGDSKKSDLLVTC